MSVLRNRRLKQVIVTLKSEHPALPGKSFSGVLFEHDKDAVVLRNASALGQGEKETNVGVDGELILLRSEIAFVQRP